MSSRPAGAWSRRRFLGAVGLGVAGAGCSDLRPRAPSTPETSVPLVYDEHGGLFVEARVGGSEPVRLILDTGASRSTISTDFAARLGLELGSGGEVEGSAGVVQSGQTSADVEVAGLEDLRLDLAVYGFSSYDPRCVGILGYEFLSRAPFQLRYRERELRWHARPPRRTLPLALDGGIPRITSSIDGRPVDLRIDTGAAFPPGADAYLNL